MKLVVEYYDESLEALNKGANIEDIVALPVREAIGRFKYTPEEKVNDEYSRVSHELKNQLKDAVDKKEDF